MSYPETYRYTKEHEWILLDGNKATVGITDHAQHELGDIVFVDLPKKGAAVTKGQSFGSVESVKAVSDVYSPVSGTVSEANELLADDSLYRRLGGTIQNAFADPALTLGFCIAYLLLTEKGGAQ